MDQVHHPFWYRNDIATEAMARMAFTRKNGFQLKAGNFRHSRDRTDIIISSLWVKESKDSPLKNDGKNHPVTKGCPYLFLRRG